MSELIDPYLAWWTPRASAESVRVRGGYLRRTDERLPCGLDAATGDELKAWIYQPTFELWTVFSYYHHLNAFYTWAANPFMLDYVLEFNPLSAVPRPAKPACIPHPVTDEQAAKAFVELERPFGLAAKLGAYAGLRRAEIARCDREHITEKLLRVPVGKGGSYGVVPTHPLLWQEVKDLPPGPVVRTPEGERWDPQALGNAARFRLTRLMGEKCGLHRFRHWFGTNVYRRTRDPLLTQQAMRHANPNSTIGYILIADEERAEAIGALPDLLTLAAA
jgi:integrase